jgi:signal transduction histidine kinase
MRELVSHYDDKRLHQFEAQFTQLGLDSTLIVMRDISERFQYFETEKKLIAEKTGRQKDEEANRFNRHEVKNGLLAAIGLVESIRDHSFSDISVASPQTSRSIQHPVYAGANGAEVFVFEDDDEINTLNTSGGDTADYSRSDSFSVIAENYGELDNTLRDILDTVMDHAMSLDVINEVYDARLERVSVPELLSNIRRQTNYDLRQSRFPLECSPVPFPILALDPRLLRYIYQNALSNASRYGKANGRICTKISYNEHKEEFKMVRIVFRCLVGITA